MSNGKTNQNGRIENAGLLRHKDVSMCGLSAMAFCFSEGGSSPANRFLASIITTRTSMRLGGWLVSGKGFYFFF